MSSHTDQLLLKRGEEGGSIGLGLRKSPIDEQADQCLRIRKNMNLCRRVSARVGILKYEYVKSR